MNIDDIIKSRETRYPYSATFDLTSPSGIKYREVVRSKKQIEEDDFQKVKHLAKKQLMKRLELHSCNSLAGWTIELIN